MLFRIKFGVSWHFQINKGCFDGFIINQPTFCEKTLYIKYSLGIIRMSAGV